IAGDLDGVGPAAVVDDIATVADGEQVGIVAGITDDAVVTGSASDDIRARAAADEIVAATRLVGHRTLDQGGGVPYRPVAELNRRGCGPAQCADNGDL